MPTAKPSKPKAVKPAAAAPVVLEAPEAAVVPEDTVPAVADVPQSPQAPTVPPAAPAAADDLNQPGFPLHPERVWPD
ncbi:hypothetical protein [Candidatus Thiothrix anitrata]|uniref:Uncharacterized protein n=1 Tax=Candidatus Thiothrix anitrata TaxID=2823902 RepID=A0ABX7X8E7_9GAMM|nr:hypothetical protein [Candidatus Thiothrix anitrata]QTR51502.1 hypothetical protein J8380_08165 [Candidatus Thiothrix anitrata]